MIKKGDIIEMKICDLAFGGNGIAKVLSDSRLLTVFVEGAVPGDIILGKIFEFKKNLVKANIIRFLNLSKDRIVPKCPHFGRIDSVTGKLLDPYDRTQNCGGCSWQFLNYKTQLKIKEKIVKDAFVRIGKISPEDYDKIAVDIKGMENPWFYRNKMEFSFEKSVLGKISLGLHLKMRHHDTVEINECFLFSPWIGKLLIFLRIFFSKTEFSGDLKTLTVRRGVNTGEVMVILSIQNGNFEKGEIFCEEVRDFFDTNATGEDKLETVIMTNTVNKKGFSKRKEEKILLGKGYYTETLSIDKLKPLKFIISEDAFFQPNTKQAEYLYSKVAKLSKLERSGKCLDLFSGTGTIAMVLAQNGASVIAVEINENASKNGIINAKLNNIGSIDFICADVSDTLKTLRGKVELVVIDPPRAGLSDNAIKKLIKISPKKIISISCNPSTLARDARILIQNGYYPTLVEPVDQFCHTWHIECITVFERKIE